MSFGTHIDADVILEAKTLDAMLAAERARVRESEVAPLVALLRRALPLRHRQPECALIPCTCGVEALAADIRAAIQAHEEGR